LRWRPPKRKLKEFENFTSTAVSRQSYLTTTYKPFVVAEKAADEKGRHYLRTNLLKQKELLTSFK
jgi:hypothetical protein